METPGARLAVARLTEAGDAASLFRRLSDQPLQGYCLVAGDAARCTVTIYVENGLTHVAVLEGDLVWLRGRPESEVLEVAAPKPEPVEVGASLKAERTPWVGMLSGAGSAGAAEPEPESGTGAGSGSGFESESDSGSVSGSGSGAGAEDGSGSESGTGAEDGSGAAPDATEGFRLVPDPAIPVQADLKASAPAAADPVPVPMATRHPLAPRAGGSAQLHMADGRVTMTLRGMPSPAALGRTAGSPRPWSAYRVWLLNQRAGIRQPLGQCHRVWGENFRYESDPGLPLERFDAVLVTADDRSGGDPDAQAPQVLMGTFSPPQS